jgi:hypothetical protein
MFPKALALFCPTLLLLAAAGCGEPGSPQPPSLNLPVPVRDLAAQRSGDVVHLTWTTTRKTTDHTSPSGQIITRICRMVANSACDRVADERRPLGAAASYDDILPVNLASGPPALLTYYVELVNHAQKSAGRSNAAYTADGPAPPALSGLAASLRAEGVVLHWDPVRGGACADCRVRIERVLQGKPAQKPVVVASRTGPSANLLAPPPPAPRQTLEVAANDSATAIDQSAAFGETYEYRALRVESLTLDGHAVELRGQESAPVSMQTRDTFPPAVPQDLAAVADGHAQAIDLSWSADTEPDLAGYIVYRREAGEDGAPQRISGAAPLPTPSFRDAQVQPGMQYRYSVSAIDQTGNESGRSVEAEEALAPPQ